MKKITAWDITAVVLALIGVVLLINGSNKSFVYVGICLCVIAVIIMFKYHAKERLLSL